uniref:EGF-like domain-containing protein n=1 Tax=Electrophorus electricus TaxID=8005 RepID=A0AAY5EP87_ELEEL
MLEAVNVAPKYSQIFCDPRQSISRTSILVATFLLTVCQPVTTSLICCLFMYSPCRPNVCTEQEVKLVAQMQPCVQAFTCMDKMWKQGCHGHTGCMGYERRKGNSFITTIKRKMRFFFLLWADWKICGPINFFLKQLIVCVCVCVHVAVHYCSISNGGCEHYSVQKTAAHFQCQCHSNYTLTLDGIHFKRECVCTLIWTVTPPTTLHPAPIGTDTPPSTLPLLGLTHHPPPLCTCNHGYQVDDDLNTLCVSERVCLQCTDWSTCCEQDCMNYPGGYACYCAAGCCLGSDGYSCDDIDEYLAENSGCEHMCQNSAGSFQCYCSQGHHLDKGGRSTCQDCSLCLSLSHTHTLTFFWSLLQYGCVNGGVCNTHRSGYDWLQMIPVHPSWQTCPESWYGRNCSFSCKCKNRGVCDPVIGSCHCTAGLGGDLCQDGCPKGQYGRHCNKKCNCPNNGWCHRMYEACLCDPGLYRRFCHLPCPKWVFGAGCSEECKCVQQNTLECYCRHGNCICKPGYQGDRCQEGCDAGFYGQHCEEKEISCPSGMPCNPVARACQQQCPAGNEGENQGDQDEFIIVCVYVFCMCVSPACPTGHFGQGCQMKCVCENSSRCHPVTGRCTCTAGWTGNNCRKACDAGYWGVDCASMCDCRNSGGSCDDVTGQCVCDPGFTGVCCDQKCPTGFFGPDCQQHCQCDNEASCDHVSGACTCKVGWTGTFCEKFNRSECHLTGACVCPAGWLAVCSARHYGLDCAHVALCNQGAENDPVTGKYVPGCHGEGSSQDCSQHCNCSNRGVCDTNFGNCTCRLGFTGSLCEKVCPTGLYGPRCQTGHTSIFAH